jgi:hypothetical protein
VALLWLSLAAGFAVMLLELDASLFAEMEGFAWIFVGALAAIYAFFAALIFLVSRRKNWARIAVLVVAVVSLVSALAMAAIEDTGWTSYDTVSQLGFLALDGTALYWLFTGAGAAWFRKQKTQSPT